MTCLTGCLCTEILVLLATLVGAFVWYMRNKFTYWKKMGVPYVEPSIPFGNVGQLFRQKKSFGGVHIDIYNKLKAQGHRFGGMYFFGRPMFIPIDPEIVKSIMQTDFHKFVDRGMYVNEKSDPLSAHLFSLEGTRWRNLRAKLTPTFTSGKMKFMFHTLVDCSKGIGPLIDSSKGQPIDIKDIVRRFTTDVIGSCAFGIDCNSLKNPINDFTFYGNKAFNPSPIQAIKAFASFAFPELMLKLDLTFQDQEVVAFFKKVVKETVEFREKNNVQRKDFMNLLLQLKNKGNVEDDEESENAKVDKSEEVEQLSLDQITAQSFLFYLAGFETSSTTLTFCLFELTQQVDIQEKVRKEINTVLKKYDGKITYESLTEMKYLENTIEETLRIHPPVPVLNRVANEEYTIPGTDIVLPVGTRVFIVNEGMQMDPEHFPNPKKFDPDRFTDEVKETRHPYTHLPFGEGPRHCIGLRFGMMQVKMGLVVLLRDYKFTLNEKTKVPLKMKINSFVNAAEGDIWLNANKIE